MGGVSVVLGLEYDRIAPGSDDILRVANDLYSRMITTAPIRTVPMDIPEEFQFIYQALVHRFIKQFTFQGANKSNFFQRCTTGAALISAIPRKILSLSSALDFTLMCLRKVCAIFPKSVSTRLSHEPCLGVWT